MKLEDINKETAKEWALYFPYLHETKNNKPLGDEDINDYIGTLKSIHHSIKSIGANAFETEVVKLLNEYVRRHMPWMNGHVQPISNLDSFGKFLSDIKDHTHEGDGRLVFDMLYHCISRLTYESSAFSTSDMAVNINRYGLSRGRPFSIETGMRVRSGKKHSLIQIANKRANDRRFPLLKCEKEVLGITMCTRIKKNSSSLYVEFIPTGLKKQRRLKVYVLVDESIIKGKDVSCVRTIEDVWKLCIESDMSNVVMVERTINMCNHLPFTVTVEQCEGLLENVMKFCVQRGVSSRNVWNLTRNICGSPNIDDSSIDIAGGAGFDTPIFENITVEGQSWEKTKRQGSQALSGIGESLKSRVDAEANAMSPDPIVPTLPGMDPPSTNKDASDALLLLQTKNMSTNNQDESLPKRSQPLSESNATSVQKEGTALNDSSSDGYDTFEILFGSDIAQKEKDEAEAKAKKKEPKTFKSKDSSLDGRDVGLTASNDDVFEVKDVLTKIGNRVLLEWAEDTPGQHGDDRFQWVPSSQVNKTAMDEFKSKRIRNLKSGVSVSVFVHVVFLISLNSSS
jgi:hypothetical protein